LTSALVIIDVQNAVLRDPANRDRQPIVDAAFGDMVGRLQLVQRAARRVGAPVVVVQHDGGPGHRLSSDGEGWRNRDEIKALAGEKLVRKTSCDSFFETDLAEYLAERNVTRLVIGGCMTQFCVDTTCRRAVSLGYDVTLLADGHMTADMGDLTFAQIIAHHNAVLDGFDAGAHAIELRTAAQITF
jgi:nicotinamidase-related amidase